MTQLRRGASGLLTADEDGDRAARRVPGATASERGDGRRQRQAGPQRARGSWAPRLPTSRLPGALQAWPRQKLCGPGHSCRLRVSLAPRARESSAHEEGLILNVIPGTGAGTRRDRGRLQSGTTVARGGCPSASRPRERAAAPAGLRAGAGGRETRPAGLPQAPSGSGPSALPLPEARTAWRRGRLWEPSARHRRPARPASSPRCWALFGGGGGRAQAAVRPHPGRRPALLTGVTSFPQP